MAVDGKEMGSHTAPRRAVARETAAQQALDGLGLE